LTTTRDAFPPYARVYQTEEGFGHGNTNRFGRYTTEFRLLRDSYRIGVIGGPKIQALQVDKDQNVGVQLEQLLAGEGGEEAAEGVDTEVLTLGHPDYGPGLYLSNWLLNVADLELEIDEAIVFFDLGSDFQIVDGPGYGVPHYRYAGQGQVALSLENFYTDLHGAEHEVYEGHEGFQLTRVIGSQYLTPRYVAQLLSEPATVSAQDIGPAADSDIPLPNGFVFNEESNGEAVLIAASQINMAQEQLDRSEIGMKLVTIPVFTDAFYEQTAWNTTFGDSDLLLPEQEMRQAAANYGMPFLGLGAYMASQGMTPDQVRALYFDSGQSYFTPEGHLFAAEAVYECFFAETLTAEDGCDRR
jgi:hypothetical protein